METLVKILAATAILGVLVSWITYGLLAWMRESAPWLLHEPGRGADLPAPTRKKTRIVPKVKVLLPGKALSSATPRESFFR